MNLTFYRIEKNGHDMWFDRRESVITEKFMTTETFDLEKALAGHPVRLRNGEKAYIRFREAELHDEIELGGYRRLCSGAYVLIRWNKDGETNHDNQ